MNVSAIDPIGNYAVKLTFDDGHDTGIYREYLRELGEQREERWASYLAEVEAANASRLPPIQLGQWTRPPIEAPSARSSTMHPSTARIALRAMPRSLAPRAGTNEGTPA